MILYEGIGSYLPPMSERKKSYLKLGPVLNAELIFKF